MKKDASKRVLRLNRALVKCLTDKSLLLVHGGIETQEPQSKNCNTMGIDCL
jgi:hypothetical protein